MNLPSVRASAADKRRPEPAVRVPVTVIGAVNLDLSGTPSAELRQGDSNPGRVAMVPGGVGRNIAENLVRLNHPVSLITLMGNDPYARLIRDHCAAVGIGMEHSLSDPRYRTSVYLCVNERNGDLHTAVSDMSIYEHLTPDRLRPLLGEINRSSLVIADANLPAETLDYLASAVTAPIAADPVSVAKVCRLKGLLSRLEILKPNAAEAEQLTGIPIRGESGLADAAEAMLQAGVRRVYISLGPCGVYAADRSGSAFLPCFAGRIVNTTGCGDAFLAAAADAWLRGEDTFSAARAGLAAAAWCAADDRTVSPTLSPIRIQEMLEKES